MNNREKGQGSALACSWAGDCARDYLIQLTVDIKMRRESRQKRVLKKERTEEKRVTFLVNKQVCLQDPKSKKLNIQGVIRDRKVNACMI